VGITVVLSALAVSPGRKRVRNKREKGLLGLVSTVARWLVFQLINSKVMLFTRVNILAKIALKAKITQPTVIFFLSECACQDTFWSPLSLL
jgi:hypothetical protein